MNYPMKAILILLSIVFITSRDVPVYDSYVFAIQWKNNVCSTDKPLCYTLEGETEPNRFTIHGLWPSLKSGVYLAPCLEPQSIDIRSDGTGLFANLQKVWASYYNPDATFWTHEYNKHGYCYVHQNNLSGPRDYFKKTLELYYSQDYRHLFQKVFPNQPAGEITLTQKELREKIDRVFPGQFYKLYCNKRQEKYYLTEIFLNFDLDFKPFDIPDTQEPKSCPVTEDQKIHILFK